MQSLSEREGKSVDPFLLPSVLAMLRRAGNSSVHPVTQAHERNPRALPFTGIFTLTSIDGTNWAK